MALLTAAHRETTHHQRSAREPQTEDLAVQRVSRQELYTQKTTDVSFFSGVTHTSEQATELQSRPCAQACLKTELPTCPKTALSLH